MVLESSTSDESKKTEYHGIHLILFLEVFISKNKFITLNSFCLFSELSKYHSIHEICQLTIEKSVYNLSKLSTLR
jgi:hypothetical protein